MDINTLAVIKKSSSSLVVSVFGVLTALGVSIFLGRNIGPEGVGIINLSNQIALTMTSFCLFGLSNLLVKNISILKLKNDWKGIKDLMHSSYIFSGILSFSITIIMLILVPVISVHIFNEPNLTIPLSIAALFLFAQVLIGICSSTFIGFGKIWQGNLFSRPLSIFLTAVVLLFIYRFNGKISIIDTAMAYAVGVVVVALAGSIYWKSRLPANLMKSQFSFEIVTQAKPFFYITFIGVLSTNIDKLMLGWLLDSKELGLYIVASQLAMLMIFFQQVTNASLSPRISTLFHTDNIADLELLIRRVNGWLCGIGITGVIFFMLCGKFILGFWGTSFQSSTTILIILAIGQFFNISTGSVASIMNMCGMEKLHSKMSIIFLILNILLNYIFITNWGTIGLALSTALNVAIVNISKAFVVKRMIGISVLPLLR